MNIAELLLESRQRYGKRVTIHFDGGEWTNFDMIHRAEQLATVLLDAGVLPGDRVVVMMLNCPEVIQAFHALWRVGAIPVPVTPQWVAREVHFVVEHSGAKVLLTSPLLAAKVREATADLSPPVQLFVFGDTDIPGICD
ncbi:MAG: AMP-binding protein, partial [Pirellula staleyi]